MKEQGFVALMSAIVITVLLLAITFSVCFSDFFTRFNVLDSESKQISANLAEACADAAQLTLTKNPNSQITSQIVTVGSGQCTIVSATKLGNQNAITTQAVVNKAYTNLKIVRDSTTGSIISWDECANLNSC